MTGIVKPEFREEGQSSDLLNDRAMVMIPMTIMTTKTMTMTTMTASSSSSSSSSSTREKRLRSRRENTERLLLLPLRKDIVKDGEKKEKERSDE